MIFSHSSTDKIFLKEWNPNFPFYVRQQEYQPYKWNTCSHTKWQIYHKLSLRVTGLEPETNTSMTQTVLKVIRSQNQLGRCPNDTRCSQMVVSGSQMSEPVSKNAQVAIHANKWSSLADRHQNQLAKMPNCSQCSEMILNIRHTHNQLAGVPSSTACSKQFSTSDTRQNQLAGIPRQRLFLLLFSCSVLCNPMECSTPGFPVLNYLL